MRRLLGGSLVALCTLVAYLALHYPLLDLPYFWDEAGYYIPAALDFFHRSLLIPKRTLPTGHTPFVPVYLAAAWKVFGCSPITTRTAMLLLAFLALVALYALARQIVSREVAAWSCLLLALSPLFFVQSTLAHLDLAAGVFTLLATITLLRSRYTWFAIAASLAVLSKETAVVLLPVAWLLLGFRAKVGRTRPARAAWLWTAFPLLPFLAWTVNYHHATGYWTGNSEYLRYNLYSTLSPARFLLTLLRRLYELFVGGFNWVVVLAAIVGSGQARKGSGPMRSDATLEPFAARREFYLLAGGLSAAYLLLLSLVGGAVLPRYLLPVVPFIYLISAISIWRLRKPIARLVFISALACFVCAWFLNPPYPFPFEDNLAYADFIRLHQQAADFLERLPGEPRILTAWPATDELAHPVLGYIPKPLRVVAVAGFTESDFRPVAPDSFDLLYFYSRKWEPHDNWVERFPVAKGLQQRYFDYAPQIADSELIRQFGLRLIAHFEGRGQWVRIYSRH
jgi:hypothetical protein